jgi:hypothetical protein
MKGSNKMKNNNNYSVIYRTGGTVNFKWKRVLNIFIDKESAQMKKDELEKMGYKTLIFKTDQLNSIGLPESYDVETPIPE